jgi:hypothetical protein
MAVKDSNRPQSPANVSFNRFNKESTVPALQDVRPLQKSVDPAQNGRLTKINCPDTSASPDIQNTMDLIERCKRQLPIES